jgi:hypothetical protein
MDPRERIERIEEGRRNGTCPYCGEPVVNPVGSGRLADGVFCKLEHVAAFYADYFKERVEQSTPRPNGD